MSSPDGERIALVHIGNYGWTAYYEGGNTRLQHYGDTWRERVQEFADLTYIVDTRPLHDDDYETLVDLAYGVGIVDPRLAPGEVQRPFGRGTTHYEPNGTAGEGRDPRFGNTGGFDTLAPDVYAAIHARFGARVVEVRGRDLSASDQHVPAATAAAA